MPITNNVFAETIETKEEMNEQLTKIADGWMQKAAPMFNDLSISQSVRHLVITDKKYIERGEKDGSWRDFITPST